MFSDICYHIIGFLILKIAWILPDMKILNFGAIEFRVSQVNLKNACVFVYLLPKTLNFCKKSMHENKSLYLGQITWLKATLNDSSIKKAAEHDFDWTTKPFWLDFELSGEFEKTLWIIIENHHFSTIFDYNSKRLSNSPQNSKSNKNEKLYWTILA